MTLALMVALLAAVGASCRYVVDQFIQHQHDSVFPWGTFAINVVGSFVLGVVTGSVSHHGLSTTAAAIIGAGFCAGFTTFSTWMLESHRAGEDGDARVLWANIAVSLAAGLAAVALGHWIGGLL